MQLSWIRSLNVQLIALLTLALFPLGAIAVFQTDRVSRDAQESVNTALLGLTERAARREQVLIERAVGVARFFSSLAPELVEQNRDCTPVLSRFVQDNSEFSFIGIVRPNGVVTCSSSGLVINVAGTKSFNAVTGSGEASINVAETGFISSGSTFVVSEPLFTDGEFDGYVAVAIPHKKIPDTSEEIEELGLVELVTFNENGTILTARSDRKTAEGFMPSDRTLTSLSTNRSDTFVAQSVSGVDFHYSIVTIEGSPAAVIAVWELGAFSLNEGVGRFVPLLFPLLMWIASVAVAMMAMHSLVLRHINRLRRTMDEFADDRRVTEIQDRISFIPSELEELDKNFLRMSEEIMADEALLEDSVREKNVLVKEIHHRVKNNLQLISSIMNMQIRNAKHGETKKALRTVQERVLSMATIHRDLYQSQNGGRVNAGYLVSEIVEKSVSSLSEEGLNVRSEIEDILLYPDQAVPLSLLVAEAMTNALKFLDVGQDGEKQLAVKLMRSDDSCQFEVSNSTKHSAVTEMKGLGSKLMQAFAMQLGASLQTDQSEEKYVLSVSFKINDFEQVTPDF
ncbi:sensor histidine kinase [Yoonia litorea]|uniref:histidine kinase n=1 Tax=Yoonia litorea TaxID=1123755 RepID=A0A1I6LNK4_9RHOB|nr:sensor histidine kinase [Yoonia litorea]SFS05066.1 Two-component sensor histidine kinase, contains HisKA and HATPase domains [Yoonia litorea]